MLAAASSLPLALVQSGAALRAPQLQPLSAQCKVNGMVGDCKPLGYFDPLGFSKDASPETMAKFREAELKHGRVAMLASVGYLVGAAKISFPGELAKGVTFASVAANGPYQAWDAVPQAGKLQILSIILALEWATEAKKPHYMRGGVPGKIEQLPFDGIQGLWAPKIKFWDPLNFTGALSAEQKARKRKAELKNGRLAMIGIISFACAEAIPGSVPFYPF
mmetsp:Transcript_38114/g.123324  ORF Transcript_38114/g.123324 Transcript_38114/m.123324 type:complete len:220 (-) Transcript_38114:206-865(-)